MKKALLILLVFTAAGFALWYGQGIREEKAETLLWAAYDGDLTGVKNALEDGAETDRLLYITDPLRHYKDAEFSVLLAAASGGNEKLVSYLIQQGQKPAWANSQGWTPLFVAVRDGHAEAAARLMQAGADPNAQTDTGATPLIMTTLAEFPTEKERLSLLEYLLKRGADPNLTTRFHTDALFYAATELKNPQAVDLLLQYGADPCRRYEGKTLPGIAGKTLRPALKKAYKKQCTKK